MITRRELLTGLGCSILTGDLRAGPSVTLPLTRTKTRLATVPVTIGRTAANFVLDTGAGGSLVASEMLSRLPAEDFEIQAAGSVSASGGSAAVRRVLIHSLAISPGVHEPIEANSLPFAPFRDQFGAGVDGVLGMDVVGRYDPIFDFHAQRLYLFAPATSPLHGDIAMEPAEYHRIQFSGSLNGRSVTATLDTGSVQSGVNWLAAEQAGITRTSPGLREKVTITGIDNTPRLVHEFEFKELGIGPRRWRSLTLVIADLFAFDAMHLNHTPAINLGMDVWDNHQIVVSFSMRRLSIR
jgi:predicted aspartyl protease